MKKYSVLLLYPDRLADDFGSETFYAWVEGLSVMDAVQRAGIDAVLSNLDYYEDWDHEEIVDACDYEWHVLLILEGYQRGV